MIHNISSTGINHSPFGWPRPVSALEPVSGLEYPPHDGDADGEEQERHPQAHGHVDVRDAVQAPSETAYEVDDRIKERDLLPYRRQHVYRIKTAPQERKRSDYHQRHHLELLEAVRPDSDYKPEEAEGDGGEEEEPRHPERVQNRVGDEQARRRQYERSQYDGFRGGRAHVTDQDLYVGDRRRQHLVNCAREFRQVYAEGGVGDALAHDRQHDEAGAEHRPVPAPSDTPPPRPDSRPEHHEVKRGREYWRRDALHQRPPGARHLENIYRPYRVEVHRFSLTRLTKISPLFIIPMRSAISSASSM